MPPKPGKPRSHVNMRYSDEERADVEYIKRRRGLPDFASAVRDAIREWALILRKTDDEKKGED